MNKVTVDNIVNLNPCPLYTRQYVQSLWKDKEQLSLQDILDLDIPIEDRLWVLVHLVPTALLPKWANHCAGEAIGYIYASHSFINEYSARASAAATRAAARMVNREDSYYVCRAMDAARATASCIIRCTGKNYNETLKELLEKLIEMNNETIDTKQTK